MENREKLIAEAMRKAALAQVQKAREEGEGDHRQIRNWIESIDVDAVIASVK